MRDAPSPCRGGALFQDEGHLQAEELVEREATTRRLAVGESIGGVDGAERVGAAEHSRPNRSAVGVGKRVGELSGALERFGDVARQLRRSDAGLLRLRVDRHDPSGPVTHEVDDRVHHLQPASVRVDLAEDDDGRPHLELLGPPRLVEKADDEPTRLPSSTVTSSTIALRPRGRRVSSLRDPRRDDRLLAGLEGTDLDRVRPVRVAPRVVRHEIEHALDLHGAKRRCFSRPDAVELLDVDSGQLAETTADRRHGGLGRRAHSRDNSSG